MTPHKLKSRYYTCECMNNKHWMRRQEFLGLIKKIKKYDKVNAS